MENLELKLYVVRNKKGKFFRAKGLNGWGDSWVDDLQRAKIYTKIGQARSRVTWFAGNYPQYGVPEIIVLTVKETKVLDETDRVMKAIRKKEIAEYERQKKLEEYRQKAEELKKMAKKIGYNGNIEF